MNIKIDNQMIIKLQLVNLDFFLNHNFLEPIDYLLLFFSNKDIASKRFKAKRYYLPK